MERNSKSGVIGVIITIIILVLLVVFTNRNTENISTIENFANVVIVPIQNGLTYLKNKINNNDKFFERKGEYHEKSTCTCNSRDTGGICTVRLRCSGGRRNGIRRQQRDDRGRSR